MAATAAVGMHSTGMHSCLACFGRWRGAVHIHVSQFTVSVHRIPAYGLRVVHIQDTRVICHYLIFFKYSNFHIFVVVVLVMLRS